MRAAIKLFIYVIFVLGILLGGLEVVRVTKFQIDFEDNVRLMLEDAMELSIDDTLRYSNITIIPFDQPGTSNDLTEDKFYEILKKKYHLTDQYKSENENNFLKEVVIDNVDLFRGTFSGDEYQHQQDEYPYIEVEGEIELKPLVLLFTDTMKLPFKVKVDFEGHSDY